MEISTVMARRVAAPEPGIAIPKPGKSGQAVGQLAKNAVTAAKAMGVELPSNAQGLAASQIAKGADPASIFAAQVSPSTKSVEGTDAFDPASVEGESSVDQMNSSGSSIADPTDIVPESDQSVLSEEAAIMFQSSLSVMAMAGDTSSQTALDLLS